MIEENRRRKKSLTRRITPILLVLTGGLFFSILFNFLAVVYTRYEQKQYAMMAVKAGMNALEREIGTVTRNQTKMVIDYVQGSGALYTPLKLYLDTPENSLEHLQGQEQLNNVFNSYFFDYAAKFHFFLYFSDRGQYVTFEPSSDGEEEGEIKKRIAGLVNENYLTKYPGMNGWFVAEEEQDTYLIKTLKYQEVHFGFWITAENMADLMNSLKDADEDCMILTDLDGNYLTEVPGKLENYQEEKGVFAKYVRIDRSFEKLPFSVSYFAATSGLFQRILLLQIILTAIMVGLGIGSIFYFYYTVRHIILPIQNFCNSLSSYQEESLPELDSAEILELEQVNQQFHNLIQQVTSLKISLYEKQMEQQKEIIEFMKLQIRPHFYLNCLNLAYNLVELEKYDECRQMLKLTADYFRYLLKSNMSKELIKDEISYVKSYLKIQSIRYRRNFQYDIEQDPLTEDCYIPPLIIQTFVENAVKNTVSLERPVDISVTIMKETDTFISIFITDTGDGFSEEVLSRLQNGESLERKDGTGIGITNSIKRLQYHFGDKCKVRFYNSPRGGAVVELTIPVCRKTEDEQGETYEYSDCG